MRNIEYAILSAQRAAIERLPDHLVGCNLVYLHRLMLAAAGIYLRPGARVLDFGCGSGRAVYDYRDCGFDAYGFDIADYVERRNPTDTDFFRFSLTGRPAHIPDYQVNATDYRLDFEDQTFDFVFSNSVFEHVQNHDLALREIARVLKPGGIAIHTFPPRYSLIEPHTFVPLGGAITNPIWYRLWAMLGIRNQFQRGMTVAEVVNANLQYSRTGVNYVPVKSLVRTARHHFTETILAPYLWTIGGRRHPLIQFSLVASLYSRIVLVVLLLHR
ncbi:class I SAM-dependent methyltransferase [uncultured Lamprocystis sp.]|uniref:class I SAM-dependent methyltransferase n=1 Tax=uncultured Lamprocystis sp. TaxID=543132 RepID=UPI0025FFDCF9|nr:class I SAM-dependent methyltransferase [uncultured Lamprocystis sp.]